MIFVGTVSSYAQSNADSLRLVIRNLPDGEEKVDAMNQLAFILRVADPDSTILLGRQSKEIAEKIGYETGIAHSQTRRAIAHTSLGNYYRALQLFLKAKTTYILKNDSASIASCVNNMARVYTSINDNRRALDNFKEANNLFRKLGNLSGEGLTLNNIGYIYKLQGAYDSALYFLQQALVRTESLNQEQFTAYPVYNIGAVYMLQNRKDSALIYLKRAEAMAKEYRDQYLLSLTLMDLGRMHLKSSEFDDAEKYLLDAYDVSSLAGMRPERRDASKYLSEAYEKQGNLVEALKYQKDFIAINNSLLNSDLTRKIAFQEAEYEFNQKRFQEEVERKEQELLQERQLTNAIWTRNTLIAGILILALLIFLLYRNFYRKQLAHKTLVKLNKQIEAQAVELKRANKEITTMNNNLEKIVRQRTNELEEKNQKLKSYLSSNSHIVRAPLARILGLVDLYDPKDSENLEFINESLHKSAAELDDALRNINESLSDEDQ